MKEQHKRKIQSIVNLLKELTEDLEKILAEEEQPISPRKKVNHIDGAKLIKEIEALDRQNAEEFLKNLKHSQLGEVFVLQGGSGSDKKKPKAWLVDQIIWMTFDFKQGHKAIREVGS